MSLPVVPISLNEANEFVRAHHRHHAPVPGAKFCVAVACELATEGFGIPALSVCGVAIVGRPVARMQQKLRWEVSA